MKRRITRYLIVSGIYILIFFSLVGCGSKQIVSYADYPYFSSIQDIVKFSDLVIIGKVNKVNEPVKHNINLKKDEKPIEDIYTISDIEVTQIIKGNLKEGSIIKIKQEGGKYKNKVYITKDVEFVKEGKEYIFFLFGFTAIDPQEPYNPVNPLQGYIEITEGKIKVREHNNLFKNNKLKQEVIDSIKEHIKN